MLSNAKKRSLQYLDGPVFEQSTFAKLFVTEIKDGLFDDAVIE